MNPVTKIATIPVDLARRLAIKSTQLQPINKLATGREGVAEIIDRLGYIQIDTISVVERAHHVTLWNRCPDYNPEMLHELQAIDRTIFEYWGHAASYLPIKDYRFYLRQMKSFFDPVGKWEKDRLDKYGHLMPVIMERIRNEGALGSKNFEMPEGKTRNGNWWEWHGLKTALELLFWQGQLMISKRHNFQRIYDLTERVLPNWVDTTIPSDEELGRFLVNRALQSYGVATLKEIIDHIHAAKKPVIAKTLKNMLKEGKVVVVNIESDDKTEYFMLPEKLSKMDSIIECKGVSFLSPFDNLIIQRDRTKQLFAFDYSLECYTPEAKRKHGYFVHPILWKDKLIGRFDPKADRKEKTLIIRNMLFEPEFGEYYEFMPELQKQLRRFAQFNGCERVIFEKVDPAKIGKKLEKSLR